MIIEKFEIVRLALALQIGAHPVSIQMNHHLEEDLGLDALDLVLVVLRLAESEDADFSVVDLERVTHVRDLVAFALRWSTDAERARETLPPPTEPPVRRASGMRPIALNVPMKRRAS